MMVVEIAAGTVFGSMALLADGWHMSTHMTAFLIAVLAYGFARKHRDDPRFAFGTGKIGVIGGYTSSILLLVVAAVMIYESVARLLHPATIRFGEALAVAVVGLAVNGVSALILKDAAPHSHGHGHGHAHEDKNLRAAYVHVIADAFTSVTAITALVLGLMFGITWVDSIMGFLGSLVIMSWAYGIIRETTLVLTDYLPKDCDLVDEITTTINAVGDAEISDLHVWQVSPGKYAAIVSIEADSPWTVEEYTALIAVHEELVHLTVQVEKRT
jgi:cation diffusion facilitator family transporter